MSSELIPVSMMRREIAYQKACRQGGSPQEYVKEELKTLKDDIKEFTETLEKASEEAAATLSDLSTRVDARVNCSVLENEVAYYTKAVAHSRGDKDQAQAIFDASNAHLTALATVNRGLEAKVRQMEQKVNQVNASGDRMTAFTQDVARRGSAYIGQQYRV